jgi:hypothetical protein
MVEPLQRVNFQQSDIRWVTSKEKSYGAFQVEAVLRIWGDTDVSPRQFALGAAVLAGNMYVEGGLCKNPPYSFQVAAGETEHTIFRTEIFSPVHHLGHELPVVDTHGANGATFDSFEINLNTEPAKSLRDFDQIEERFSRRERFNGLISIELPIRGRVELEFPVKHMNLLPSRKMWQLETGPVLFPKRGGEGDFRHSTLDLIPYFLHANRFDSVDFSPDFPFPLGKTSRSDNARKGNIHCQLQLLVGEM